MILTCPHPCRRLRAKCWHRVQVDHEHGQLRPQVRPAVVCLEWQQQEADPTSPPQPPPQPPVGEERRGAEAEDPGLHAGQARGGGRPRRLQLRVRLAR